MTLAARDRTAIANSVHFVFDRFLLLPLGAAIALVWANTASESYFTFSYRAAFAVNEIAMALFFGLITQEVIEAVMPGGALHTWRRWSTALVGAAGGALGAALVYIGYVQWRYEAVLLPGWPVALAVDAAASYYVLKLLYPRAAVLPFVLMLAIVTNLTGVVVVGLQHQVLRADGAALLGLALGIAAVLRLKKVRSFWPYLAIAGPLSWFAFYLEGMHPALALVPIVAFLPHEPRRLEFFADPPDDDAVHHYEHTWNAAVQGILFFFALVNAGVLLRHYDTGTWAVVLAALVGRPLGILIAVGVGVAFGLHMPKRMTWRQLVVAAFATSSGFTFALFFATGLFPLGGVLNAIKLGALLTGSGLLVTWGVARLVRRRPRAR